VISPSIFSNNIGDAISIDMKAQLLIIDYDGEGDEHSIQDWLKINRDKVHRFLLDKIQYALEENLTVIPVFKFKETGYVFSIKVENLNEYLNTALAYFVLVEEYEKCSKIVKLKQQINETC